MAVNGCIFETPAGWYAPNGPPLPAGVIGLPRGDAMGISPLDMPLGVAKTPSGMPRGVDGIPRGVDLGDWLVMDSDERGVMKGLDPPDTGLIPELWRCREPRGAPMPELDTPDTLAFKLCICLHGHAVTWLCCSCCKS